MSKKKLTPWFLGHVDPVRSGIYETDSEVGDGSPCFQYWDGTTWGACSDSIHACKSAAESWKSMYQLPRWRGLAEKP